MTTRRDAAGEENPDRSGGTGTVSPLTPLDERNPRERPFPGRVRRGQFTADSFPSSELTEEEALAAAEPGPEIVVTAPDTFEKLAFHVLLVNRSREAHVVVEQTIAAGVTGSTTVAIPANQVEIQRFFVEGGDGSVTYSVDIQAAGQTAVAAHRITGGQREFARYWEKTTQVIIDFTNNDLVNASLLQLSWLSIQLDASKWNAYRDNLISLSDLLGIEP